MTTILPLATHATGRAHVSVYADAATMGAAAAEALAKLDRGGVAWAHAEGRRRALAISGGSTPVHVFRALAGLAAHDAESVAVHWDLWQVFQVDERPVRPDHSDSNYGLAQRELLIPCGIPAENVRRMLGEAPSLVDEAARYEGVVRACVAADASGVPRFDLILLGMGDDGHTASLFPGTAALDEGSRLVVANEVPDKDTTRLTMTLPLLNAAAAVWFLATGASKAAHLRDIVAGSSTAPAARVRPRTTPRWFVDAAAASLLAS